MQFPYRYYEGNVIVNRLGEWWAAYKLPSFTYEFLDEADKLGWWQRLSRLFGAMELEAQLLVVPRTIAPAEPMYPLMESPAPGQLARYGSEYLQQLARHLEGDEPAVEYEAYILYRLPRPTRGMHGAQLRWHFRRLRRAFDEWRRGVPLLVDTTLEAYMAEEEQLYSRLQEFIRAQRCTPQEITWLIQRRYWAGIAEPPVRRGWQPDTVARPGEDDTDLDPCMTEILSLAQGEIDLRHWRRIAVRQVYAGAERTGYQAFMAVSATPDEMTMPGAEWLFRLQNLRFPVEAAVRWSTVGYRDAVAALRRKRMETADQMDQATSTGERPALDVMDADSAIEEAEQELRERRCPALLATAYLSVSASTEQELWRRVTAVQDTMSDVQMPAELPAGDQHKLFHEFLPGSPREYKPGGPYAPDPPYLHRWLPEVLAAGMVGATQALGDPVGVYIGRTGALGRPIYWQASRGPKINRSASIAFLGTLGGGKTFTARLIALLAALTQGARVLMIDPKGESQSMFERLPQSIQAQTNLISLSSREEDTGLLDLLAMARTGAKREAGNLAVSVLSYLVDARTREEQLAIHEAVEAALQDPAPSMSRVIDHMISAGGVAREMGRYLGHLRSRAYANLLFGDGRERSLDVRQAINILQLQHLQLPERGKAREDMTPEEVISSAVMFAVVGFASHFVAQDRHVFKLVLLDEAWKVMASSTGLGVVTHLLRTGRAMNAGIYLISQSVADLSDETIRNNVGAKFVFRSSDQAEVEGVLRFLNLEASPENIATIRELGNGQCLVQDMDGRIGVVQVDAVFREIVEAFDTRPPEGATREVIRK